MGAMQNSSPHRPLLLNGVVIAKVAHQGDGAVSEAHTVGMYVCR